ncbi:MAG: hypothetical protein F4053_03280 [Proteobacteria bacterium]|nr:hypothetical protein [Pseudomonadota bacterium]
MLKNLILGSYSILIEVALWLLFAAALIGGYMVNEVIGAIVGLILAFLFAVLVVAPFLLIEDIRNRVRRIEAAKTK